MNLMVSVFMITYNHEKYISEALDSILMQEVDFTYEIVVGEDCSTDNTRQILLEYKNKYPDKLKLILHNENIGMISNMITTWNACKGKYIAMLEGDDYWTDSLKLQKQVDFLENNFDYTICVCASNNYDEDEHKVVRQFPELTKEIDFTLKDLFISNIANTCTVMYRNVNIKIPDVFKKFSLADWPLHMLYAEKGKIRYLPNIMAVYRLHDQGIWSKNRNVDNLENAIDMLKEMNIFFEKKFENEIYKSISKLLLIQSFEYLQLKEIKLFLDTFKKSKLFFSTSLKEVIIAFRNSFL